VAVSGLWTATLVRAGAISLPVEDPVATAFFVVAHVAVLAWLATTLLESWRRWRVGLRLTQFVDLLRSEDPESLTNSLRRALSDPDLQVAYRAPARQAYVDGHGRVTNPWTRGAGGRVTRITRRGQTIAMIIHSRRVNGRRLQQAMSPSLLLAVENAQLHAAAMAELSELTESRTRVVNRTELERQRLERNLHDGAQQRVVSLALLVRRLAGRMQVEDPETAVRAEVLTRTLVEELRRVARGIYPAVLADAGLLGGVLDLAESSEDLPVVVEDFPDKRYPGAVETTAYLLLGAGIIDARARGAKGVTLAGEDAGDVLRVTVMDDAWVARC
jgi:signal transduction histidine kinase